MGEKTLDTFFTQLDISIQAYVSWTSEVPKYLLISPEIVGFLAKQEGFYQRPELASMVTLHSPVVRTFKLRFGTVTLVEDWEEKFYHFE